MLLAFNIIFFAYISRVLGGLYTKPNTDENLIPRYVSLPACFIVIAINTYPDIVSLVAWCWLFWCIRLFPTQALFTAVHGKLPNREDWITKLVPPDVTGYNYGIWAGFIRTMPTIPAMLIIGNPFLAMFFNIGFFYYIAGFISKQYNGKDNVRWVEMFIGGLFGLFIS